MIFLNNQLKKCNYLYNCNVNYTNYLLYLLVKKKIIFESNCKSFRTFIYSRNYRTPTDHTNSCWWINLLYITSIMFYSMHETLVDFSLHIKIDIKLFFLKLDSRYGRKCIITKIINFIFFQIIFSHF
uniref:Uncharacterized protein n=1 Tax=Heterorhabditis bacteriophora TaxID=37862 RepID=A0A1I7WSV2_HETBA